MFKPYYSSALLLGLVLSNNAMAACADSGNAVDGSVFEGQTICYFTPFTQEEHHANGELWDYKKGPSDPLDPKKKIGNWSYSSNRVTYTYPKFMFLTYTLINLTIIFAALPKVAPQSQMIL